MNLVVIGLGKLGLPSAACLAWAGHKVIGVDNNLEHVATLVRGINPILEPDLTDLLESKVVRENLSFTTDVVKAVQDADIILIIVPTPSGQDDRFSNRYVLEALKQVGVGLKARAVTAGLADLAIPIVDVVSTVMPGSCSKVLIPALEAASGLTCPRDFGFVYNPEFIALGSVVRNFLVPDMTLIGESDPRSGLAVQAMYTKMFQKASCQGSAWQPRQPAFHRMKLTDAEITKLCLNVYLSFKIGFANLVGVRIVPVLGGEDPDAVLNAIGVDMRIGSKLLKAGMGVGGPCLPRDVRALIAATSGLNLPLNLPEVSNEEVLGWHLHAVDAAVKYRTEAHDLLCLGASYKPGTPHIDESMSVQIICDLAEAGWNVLWHDPHVDPNALTGTRVRNVLNIREAIMHVAAVLYLTPHTEYQALPWDEYAELVKPGTPLIDCWRTWPADKAWKNFRYIAMGRPFLPAVV